MKRALMFLLLGPTLVVAAWLIHNAALDGLRGPFEAFAMIFFILAFIVAAITAPIDGYLARALPIYLRAPLTAIAGATIAVGMVFTLVSTILSQCVTLPQSVWMTFAIGGALCMGTCSLLSNDCGRGQRLAVSTEG